MKKVLGRDSEFDEVKEILSKKEKVLIMASDQKGKSTFLSFISKQLVWNKTLIIDFSRIIRIDRFYYYLSQNIKENLEDESENIINELNEFDSSLENCIEVFNTLKKHNIVLLADNIHFLEKKYMNLDYVKILELLKPFDVMTGSISDVLEDNVMDTLNTRRIFLNDLEEEDWIDYKSNYKGLPEELLNKLYNKPYHFWDVIYSQKTKKSILSDLLIKKENEYISIMSQLTKNQLKTFFLLAISGGKNIYAQKRLDDLGLSKTLVERVISSQVFEDHFSKLLLGNYEFKDPLFEYWMNQFYYLKTE